MMEYFQTTRDATEANVGIVLLGTQGFTHGERCPLRPLILDSCIKMFWSIDLIKVMRPETHHGKD